MGSATSAQIEQFAKDIPDDASKEEVLALARQRFDNAAVAAMEPLYAAFKEEHDQLASVHCIDRKSILDVDLEGVRVLLRVDFNVPLDKKTGAPTNTMRIEAAIPTIEYALECGAKSVVVLSHLGRPKGHHNPRYSLAGPVHKAFEEALGKRAWCASQRAEHLRD